MNTDPELLGCLRRINCWRRAGIQSAERRALETLIEATNRCSIRLAVYGSLAPGELNHHVIADLTGSWRVGYVTGELYETGWGATSGYPGIRWDPEAAPVAVKLFTSVQLRFQWHRLDRFEGPEYCRVLAPVVDDRGVVRVANLYEIRSLPATVVS